MVNFICQVARGMKFSHIESNILGVSVRVFLDEISICTSRMRKADCFL